MRDSNKIYRRGRRSRRSSFCTLLDTRFLLQQLHVLLSSLPSLLLWQKTLANLKLLNRFRRKEPIPVHKSSFNPADDRPIISAKVTTVDGKKEVHHIYQSGKGTAFLGDKIE